MDHDVAPVARPRLRWGLPDVLVAWLAGLCGAVLFAAFAGAADPGLVDRAGSEDIPSWFVLGALLTQNTAIVLVLVFMAERKGRGSLALDFGLVAPWRRLSAGACAGWIAAGAGLSLGAGILLRPIAELADLDQSAQQVSRTVERAGTGSLVLLLIGIVVVAPLVEELLFRGALLRALQRRCSVPVAVFVSAAVFAGVHVVGDPGSYYVVPGLLLLGIVAGWQAARSGDLVRPLLLHVGFNLLSAVTLAFL